MQLTRDGAQGLTRALDRDVYHLPCTIVASPQEMPQRILFLKDDINLSQHTLVSQYV